MSTAEHETTGPLIGRGEPVIPGIARLDRWLLDRRPTSHVLAEPPPDSGLKPVLGDSGAPLLGHTVEILRLGINYWLKRYETHGPVSWIRAFGRPLVSAGGAEAAQEVLANRDKAFSQQGWTYFIGPFFNRGLMLLDFEEHLYHRRLMQEAFTRDRVAGYVGRVSSLVRSSVPAWGEQRSFPVYPALKQLTLDVATDVFMSADLGAERATLTTAFIDTVRAGTALVRRPVPGGRWGAGLRGRRVLEDFFRRELPARRAEDAGDLFSALCHARNDEGERFDDEDVVNHMIFLMMAAHDTSTIATTSVVYHLARNPEWQERARAESLALGDGPLDTAALDTLHTLDLVIKESLRLVAPVPATARMTVKDTQLLGHFVPAGTLVAVMPWLNHLLPEYWPDPMVFDPGRFAEDRREDKVHRYAWMPFGGGVHKCIGMHFGTYEIKTLMHEMLRTYRWSVPDDYRVRWDATALPVPADNLPVRLTSL